MVAITISIFLLLGLFTILQQTRKTNTATTSLAQLQDDERVAMTIITDTIEEAGSVPEANGSGQSLFVVDSGGGFVTAGQIINSAAYTTSNNVVTGERMTMRYVLGVNNTVILCDGEQPAPTADTVYKEIFQVDLATTGPGAGQVYQLMCIPKDGATGVPLVNNIVSLTFQWAVNTTSASSNTASNTLGPNTEASHVTGYGCPSDTWLYTANMSQYDWTNVCAVKVDLVFLNPLYLPPGTPTNRPTPGQQPYITFERVISILTKTGVNITSSTTS
jgi:type IV pilus assembly protein PilW